MTERSDVAGPANPIILTALLGAMSAFSSMSIDMYLPAFPTLTAAFQTEASHVQLTLSAFFLGFGVGQLLWGPLADQLGRRPPLYAGMALYILGSILCARASSIETLIVARFVQALGACTGPVIARAIVRDVYARDRAARMMSLMVLAMGAAPLLAPLIGSQMLLLFDWRAIFWVQVGFGVLCAVAIAVYLPETLKPELRRRGGVLEATMRYRFLLISRRFMGYAGAFSFIYGGLFAYVTGSPFVFIEVYGVPQQYYGLIFGMNVAGIISMAVLNSRLVLRMGAERLLSVGLVVMAVAGCTLLAVALVGQGGLVPLLIPLFVFVASLSLVGANAMACGLALFPEIAGTASALAGTIQFLTGAIAGSLVGLLYDASARPMAAIICASGLLGLFCYRTFARPAAADRAG